MQNLNENHGSSYNLNNCFGFNENDIDLSLWEKSSVLNETNAPLEFQSHKPYRLALYVKPFEQKRFQRTKASVLMKSTIGKQPKNNKNEKNNSIQGSEKKVVKRSARINKKVNVMLFDENVKPENDSKRMKRTPEKVELKNKNKTLEVLSARKSVLKEINTKSLTKTKQNKVRKSYERKVKEEENENVPEPPSEEIIKELDLKKLARTKQKKTAKEEQEFEKWANNMNSAFDDVEKFELSIAYD